MDDDQQYMTTEQRKRLGRTLTDIRDSLADVLDQTIVRQSRFADGAARSSESTPIPFHEKASDAARHLHGVLTEWIDATARQRNYPHPGMLRTAPAAAWLKHRLIGLAYCDDSAAAYTDITDAYKRALSVCDRPAVAEFVGPCQADGDPQCGGLYCRKDITSFDCHTCGIAIDVPSVRAAVEETMRGRLFTKAELRTALVMYTKAPVSRQRIDNWIRRGRLVEQGGRYSLNEALVLVAEHTA